jgi:hypothetical protein
MHMQQFTIALLLHPFIFGVMMMIYCDFRNYTMLSNTHLDENNSYIVNAT